MRRAFSLIELLVVIAVVAALVALSQPAVASARRYAQRTAALASLDSLSHVMGWYLSDHQDTYLNPFRRAWPKVGPHAGMSWTMAYAASDPADVRWDFAHASCPELHTESFSKRWYSYLAEYRGGRRDDPEQVSAADRDLINDHRAGSGDPAVRSGRVLSQTSFWYAPKFWLDPCWFKRADECGSHPAGWPIGLEYVRQSTIVSPSRLVLLWERTDAVSGRAPLAWNDFKAHTNVAAADGSCTTVRMQSLYDAAGSKDMKNMNPLESRCTVSPAGLKSFFLHTHRGVNGRDLMR